MEDPIIWAMICFGIALILFILELFLPSGGLLGLGAGAALIAAIVLLFIENKTYGLFGGFVTLVSTPFLIAFMLKIWPQTPLARMLTLHSPGEIDDEDEPVATVAQRDQTLLGTVGKAVTDLHPVGTCLLNGKRTECLAEGGVITRGSDVKVVAADGMQIKVRRTD